MSSFAAVNGALPAISSTGMRVRSMLCIALAALAVPTSTCTNTPCPRPATIVDCPPALEIDGLKAGCIVGFRHDDIWRVE
jgi:hypothetical protein